jgi:hypothetical protein
MEHTSRYVIGIDLGTTNSVVAYSDGASDDIRVFQIPQLAAPGEIRALPTLPSFLYFPTESDQAAGGLNLPWEEQPASLAGVLAQEQGALVPGRQVSSAKSWLCHAGVDRRANILPSDAEPPEPMVSPIEASTRYLAHLRNAWNHVAAEAGNGAEARFEDQEIVLTVPASFDAEARELTVEAARQAGLKNFTLLEEPLAAFYAWIATHRDLRQQVRDGELVLICDVGGGTTDFSLIGVRDVSGEVQFERTAIGEHLLLGGDNLDLALAHYVEQKLDHPKLSVRQRHALRRACCAAKERLLADPAPERVSVNVLGSGRAVVGGMLSVELTRAEVVDLLTGGFLPLTEADDLPAQLRRAGLRELGLPYAREPAITRHLAAFLTRSVAAMKSQRESAAALDQLPPMARPDAILFNGGFFAPRLTRARMVEAVANWFPQANRTWQPKLLENEGMESGVAVGAAYYGRVRRGHGLRIRAGSARTYYIGLRSEDGIQGVCVLPAGVEEGTTLALANREFSVLANRPVSFMLYSSTTGSHKHGEVAALNEQEVHRHAPLVTLLRYGKKLRQLELAVRLTASFTEVGTLELWCESLNTEHRWRLQFELRGNEGERQTQSRTGPSLAAAESLEPAVQAIQAVFGEAGAISEGQGIAPEMLVGKLEATLGINKDSWPLVTIRNFCDVLAETSEGRRWSVGHEVRWLNLLGFCLRPGFGEPRDNSRQNQLRKLCLAGPAFPEEPQCQVEWLVMWRRVAGGVNASQQHELHRRCTAMLGFGAKKKTARLNRQVEHEAWRLLANLEHLPGPLRVSLGNQLLAKIKKEPAASAWLWSLGRLGARIPLYGPLSCVVAAETASSWMKALLDLPEFTTPAALAVVHLGSYTGDPLRDIDEELRHAAVARLTAAGVAGQLTQRLQKYVPPTLADAVHMFGESLPKGLHFVSSANCLLPVTALTSDAVSG